MSALAKTAFWSECCKTLQVRYVQSSAYAQILLGTRQPHDCMKESDRVTGKPQVFEITPGKTVGHVHILEVPRAVFKDIKQMKDICKHIQGEWVRDPLGYIIKKDGRITHAIAHSGKLVAVVHVALMVDDYAVRDQLGSSHIEIKVGQLAPK